MKDELKNLKLHSFKEKLRNDWGWHECKSDLFQQPVFPAPDVSTTINQNSLVGKIIEHWYHFTPEEKSILKNWLAKELSDINHSELNAPDTGMVRDFIYEMF